MKRAADAPLNGRPENVSVMSAKNFEFLELSICAESTSTVVVNQPAKRKKTAPRNMSDDEINSVDFRLPISIDSFKQLLSTVGPRVESIRIVSGNSVILPCVEEHCQNVNRIELLEGEGSLWLENFRNLTEMKVPNVRIPTHVFEKCLTNNPQLESLQFDHFWYEKDFMELSRMLPTLRSLGLSNLAIAEELPPKNKRKGKQIPQDFSLVPKLLQSKALTQFSFDSDRNCNELLELLPTHNPNLRELAFRMNVNSETFTLIGQLENLIVLSITSCTKKGRIGTNLPVWPSKLTRLTLNSIAISNNDLLSMLLKLESLEELHIGTRNGECFE